MSLGGTLFVLFFFVGLIKSFKQHARVLSSFEKSSIALAIAYVIILAVGLGVQPSLPNLKQALTALPLWLVPFGALLLSNDTLTLQRGKILIRALSLGYVFVLLNCLYQLFILRKPWAVAWHKNPIYLAYSLLPPLVFFGQRLRIQSKDRWLWLGAIAVFVSLFLTASRIATLVGLAYVFLAFLWPRGGLGSRSLRRWLLLLTLALALLLLLGLAAWNIEPLHKKIIELRHYQYIDSYTARMALWRHNWELLNQNLWFGVGYLQNGVNGVSNSFWHQFNFKGSENHFAHSIYFQALGESGVLGTLLLFGSLGALAWARPRLGPLLLVILVGGLTENIFSNSKPLHAFLFYSWLMAYWPTQEPSATPRESLQAPPTMKT
jgi:O-antigen ligase